MNKKVYAAIKVVGARPSLIQDGPFLRVPREPGSYSHHVMFCAVCDRRQTCDDLRLHYNFDTRQHVNESGRPQRCHDCGFESNAIVWNLRPANVERFERMYGYRVPPAR